MCDKHEIKNKGYGHCDHCGEKAQCGHLYPVWFDQEREGYDYWCYECKTQEAYKCHRCGELFPETSGSVAIYAGGQDEYHYICFDCFYAEYSRRKGVGIFEYDELCPHCGREAYGVQNVITDGYEAICNHCGKDIMLCSLCHDDDVECSKCAQVTERKRMELIKAALEALRND